MTLRLRRDVVALGALAVVAFVVRARFLPAYDEDIDTLRFALAVDRFDPAALRPHAPFYPVYVAAAKLVAALGAPRALALGLVGALAGAVVVACTALLAREVLGRRAAFIAAALALASPFLWLTSEKLLSDMTGAAFTTAALWLAARAHRLDASARSAPEVAGLRTAALIVLGLGLGARLSYFPFAIACAIAFARREGGRRAYAARARDVLFGVVLWLVPLVLVASPRSLVAVTWTQGIGHFSRWGGSIVTVSSPSERLAGLAWGAWANVLGGAWVDAPAIRWAALPALAILLFAGLLRCRRIAREHPAIAASALLYLAWAALGQNVAHKPRHLLPLAPLAIVILAAGAERLVARHRAALALPALLAAPWIVDGAALVRAHEEPSPAAALVAHLAAREPEGPVLTRDLARMIEEGAPGARVVTVRDDADLLRQIDATPGALLITSESLSPPTNAAIEARGRAVDVAFTRPRSRYVDSLWSELALLRVSPSDARRTPPPAPR